MFTITEKNTTLRNLEEQVQQNKEDIAKHYAMDRALANFGIRIVGQVTTKEELPDPETYAGSYGDAYAVGDKEQVIAGTATYTYYIFTRPDPNAGYTTNYWLDVGQISVVGPIGPQGPKGDKGDKGDASEWYSGVGAPVVSSAYTDGDMYLQVGTGNVYRYQSGAWIYQGSIKGAQGIQGPQGIQGVQGIQGPKGDKGDRGDVGGFINISGILTQENQLPLPSTLDNLTIAYLIGTQEPYNLWVQVGPNSDTAIWQNTGPFNAATLVTVGGEAQNIWSADTKVNAKANEYSGYWLYGNYTRNNGTFYENNLNARPVTGETDPKLNTVIPLYSGDGTLSGSDPIYPYNYATKKFVQEQIDYVHRVTLKSTNGTTWISEGEITGNKACMICLVDAGTSTAPAITIPADATTSYLASYSGDTIVTNISLGTYKFSTGYREYEEREIKATIQTLIDYNNFTTKIHVTTNESCLWLYNEENGSTKEMEMLILC